MSAVEKIVAELDSLLNRGTKLLREHKNGDSVVELAFEYEGWYTPALGFVRQIAPERPADFGYAESSVGTGQMTDPRQMPPAVGSLWPAGFRLQSFGYSETGVGNG